MIRTLPPEIQKALEILWEYAEDAHLSLCSKEDLTEDGMKCSTDMGWYASFVFKHEGDI